MKSKPFGALFGLLALVAILGVAPAFGQPANEIDMAKGAGSSQSADCVAAKNCFSPSVLTVAPGTTVTWSNTGDASHTVCGGVPTQSGDCVGDLTGDIIKQGKTLQVTFANAGTYDYFCSVHPWMIGQVIVAAGATTTTPNATTTTPNNATVPEFGPVASIVLAIAVMSMVVFAAKTRGIPKF
jgi:predicted secreted protein with PEFG-CTERM motif